MKKLIGLILILLLVPVVGWGQVSSQKVPYTGAMATLNLGTHNLLTTGSIGVTGSRVLYGYFTDLAVTNTITGAISGNAGTVTNGVYTNTANSMTLINPLTTIAESWIGPSSTTGIYFKGGNVGIGTTSPTQKLQVWGGNSSIWDNTVLGATSLTDGTFTLEPGAGNWGVSAGWGATFAGNTANFNIAGGAGNLTQAAAKMVGAVSLVPNRWYKLSYTVSAAASSPAATVTTAVASAATALTISNGAQVTYFKSAAAPGTFTINATAGVFSLDGITLQEIQGGSLSLGAELKLGPTIVPPGTTGDATINKASGRVNIAALGTSVTVTNNLVTANSIITATVATNDATAYVKNVVPGTGSFVVTLGAGATAEVAVNWIIIN